MLVGGFETKTSTVVMMGCWQKAFNVVVQRWRVHSVEGALVGHVYTAHVGMILFPFLGRARNMHLIKGSEDTYWLTWNFPSETSDHVVHMAAYEKSNNAKHKSLIPVSICHINWPQSSQATIELAHLFSNHTVFPC